MTEHARKSKEEKIVEIDRKIQHHKDCIEKLETTKKNLITPKPRKRKVASMNTIIHKAKAVGMTSEEIIKKLGLEELLNEES